MLRCGIGFTILCLILPASALAQASDSARGEILRKLIAEESAARIEMPFGGEGVLLSESGEINKEKLGKQIQKNGRSIQSGRIVAITSFEFNDKSVAVELDGGGKEKKRFGGHVQVSVGGATTQPNRPTAAKVRGSRIVLSFTKKVPADLTPEQLKVLLSPVLDFTKHTLTGATVQSLPPEFQEAVLAKEARIGMDQDTVILALGLPSRKTTERVNGVEQETFQYDGRGVSKTFVVFENNIVVKITEY